MRNFFKILLLLLIINLLSHTQNFNEVFITKKNPILKDFPILKSRSFSRTESNSTISTTGIDTKIYGYWDYQSNGGAINYIDVNPLDPNNIHIISMISTDSTDAIAVSMSRRVVYNFSYDAGESWGIPKIVPNIRAGYPSLTAIFDLYESYIAAISSHSLLSGYLRSSLYIDDYEGAGNFLTYITPLIQTGTDNPISPAIAQTSNGNIILAASLPTTSSLGGLAVIVFNLADRTWGNWTQFETFPNHSGRIAIATGSNGYAAVIWRSNTNPDSLLLRQSTNNGLSWNQKLTIDYENENTGPCWTGFDAIYNGTDLYVTYTKSKYTMNGYSLANEVCFWKSSTMNTVTILDSNTYPYLMKSTGIDNIQTNHNFAFNFPSIGLNSTKTRIYVGVDVFIQGEVDQDGFNYSDILLFYSDDYGISWTLPQNLTRTYNVDERYVSLAPYSPNLNDSNYVYLVYQEDKIPGANFATNSSEARPVSGVKTKFLKFNTDYIPRGTASISVNTNWNMISLPIDTVIEKTSIFPDASSNAFTLGSSGGYVMENQLAVGKAYWIKFSNSSEYSLIGKKPKSLKIPVKKGWNMIGSLSEEITVDKITSSPPGIIVSKFYGYSAGYVVINILKPGKGYWVKVHSDGLLNLITK
ncbi:MAG: hypothetical protein IGBAC_1022 [Ignavibacteriae bacterium]|nr:MAG: hypothetical protein IGBAC_1022 [Ignavibacteriota bacterium]